MRCGAYLLGSRFFISGLLRGSSGLVVLGNCAHASKKASGCPHFCRKGLISKGFGGI
jgi:hypothetical protein